MLNRLASCARVAKAFVRKFVNCFKAAEHFGGSRKVYKHPISKDDWKEIRENGGALLKL